MAQWYYTSNGQQAGPVDEAQLKGLLASGQVRPTEMVWKDGMANWQTASSVPELIAGAQQFPPQPQYPATPQYGAPTPQYGAPPYGTPQGQALNYGGYTPAPSYGGGISYRQDAQTAMICSILGLVCCGILGIVGLVLGNKAKSNMQASGNMDGEGMATAAIVMGWISIVFMVIGFIAGIAIQMNK